MLSAADRVRDGLGGAGLSLVLAQAFPGIPDAEVPGVIHRARELHGFAAFEVVPATDAATASRVAATLADGGSRSVFLAGLPLLRAGATLSGDAASRADGVRIVGEVVRAAADAGAEAVMVTSGPLDTRISVSDQASGFVDALAVLASLARDVAPGMRIRIEPTDTDVQHRQFVGATALTMELVRAVGRRGEVVDVNLDLSHLLQLGERPEASLEVARSVCDHVHLANCVLDPAHLLHGDRHPPFGTPGSLVDLDRLAAALAALRRFGYLDAGASTLVGLEVIPPAGDEPWATLAAAIDDVAHALELEPEITPRGGGDRG